MNERLALLELTAELFVEFAKACKDGPPRRLRVKDNALPDDTAIISVEALWDRPPFTLALVLHSETFDEVPVGTRPPTLPAVVFETIYDEVTTYPT